MDLAQDMVQFEHDLSHSVRETEKPEHHAISDENRRKQYRQQPKKEKKEMVKKAETGDAFVDVQA